MEYEKKEYFDLLSLLKPDDLNIRFLAEKYAVSVDEYYRMLADLINLAPNVLTALDRFAKRDGDIGACTSLENMTTLLKKLECQQFVSAFVSILDAYEKDHWRTAALYAERVREEFKGFYQRILAARKLEKPDYIKALSGNIVSLKETIENLDKIETHRKLVILAVDDSPVILKSVSSVLSDIYKVYTLPKPKELEKVLQKLTPDLFLLDYLMPELNGFELIPIIRSFEEHQNTPIIFLTSEGTIDTLTSALAFGACDFTVKPFNPEVLREKIAKHIARK